jgi:hypothetical protein
LRAFLTGDQNYQVVFFNEFIKAKHLPAATQAMPLFRENPGSALWIRKL